MNFTLQPYAGVQSRHKCPACNHRNKTFTRYINTDTGEIIAPHVGRCDREDNCGYHLKPKEYFKEAGSLRFTPRNKKQTAKRKPPTKNKPNNEPDYFIHPEYVNQSFVNYDRNNFVQYLIGRFGLDIAHELVAKYRIGTSDYWHGATIFWQLDATGHVRTGKIMLYDKATGKRVKQPFNHITWAHVLIQKLELAQEFELKQCLFGEHLLITSPFKPVAIVESEKTAIIASAVMPAFIWLASGSLEGLSRDKCRVLQGRQVILFPDVNACSKWKKRALELRRAMPGTRFAVSTEMERLATPADKEKGIDIGDLSA